MSEKNSRSRTTTKPPPANMSGSSDAGYYIYTTPGHDENYYCEKIRLNGCLHKTGGACAIILICGKKDGDNFLYRAVVFWNRDVTTRIFGEYKFNVKDALVSLFQKQCAEMNDYFNELGSQESTQSAGHWGRDWS